MAVIEDCAHTPGAEYLGRKAGRLGDLGVFSFHQQKNMCTLGEGGMVTTDSRELFEKVLSYRSLCCRIYGGSDKYLPIDEAKLPDGQGVLAAAVRRRGLQLPHDRRPGGRGHRAAEEAGRLQHQAHRTGRAR